MKNAIITGITGQDGAYLARFLLARGYRVTGAYRRTSSVNFWRLQELGVLQHKQLVLAEFDITDLSSCVRLLDKVQPDEIYNLAAQSFVGVSFEQPIATGEITGLGVVNLLEAVRIVNSSIRFYQASTSELFGKAQTVPQNESTPFYPRSPYGAAKLYAHWMTINYREAYGIFTTSGILFNHESPLRGREFVTRKISDGVARIAHGQLDTLKLGNLDAQRDWGYAEDYVIGMHSMLQVENPDTFVLATGRTATIREFVDRRCRQGRPGARLVRPHHPGGAEPDDGGRRYAARRKRRVFLGPCRKLCYSRVPTALPESIFNGSPRRRVTAYSPCAVTCATQTRSCRKWRSSGQQ